MKKVFIVLMLTPFSILEPSCLTVAEALTLPSPDTVKKFVETHNGIYSDQVYQDITESAHTILYSDDAHCPDKHPDTTKPHAVVSGLAGLSTSLSSLTIRSTITEALHACHTVHAKIAHQKALLATQEQALSSSLIIRSAQHIAFDTVIKLLLILYSPHAQPCDRMYALYLINSVNLMGNQGLLFRRFRARSNRFYFSYDGILTQFDPSKNNVNIERRIDSLDRFLKRACTSRGSYIQYLTKGIALGITPLKVCYQKAVGTSWNPHTARFEWHYAAGIFKELTTIDVMHIRTVDPQRIFSHQENRDFVMLMRYCSEGSLQQVHTLLKRSFNSSIGKIMQQYCHTLC